VSVRWLDRSVLVTVGTGGVGKTTTAAAIGLEAAARGHRALVLTIDPARRLANALGVAELDHTPRAVPVKTLGERPGELYAMMLDTKRTFDEWVERAAPDAETRERIFANPIYRNLTDALSGSREYSALEKLHQLHDSGAYDLIILDTPPAAQALQFLDAPRRLTGFLEGNVLELLMRPAAALGRASFRFFRLGSEAAIRTLSRLTGLGFLDVLSEFLLAFEGLLGGLRERAHESEKLLRSQRSGFVLVTGPEPAQVRSGLEFCERLRAERIPLAGLVVNRVLAWPGEATPETDADALERAERWLAEHFEADMAAALTAVAQRHAARARRDAEMCEQLEKAVPVAPEQRHRVPVLAEDIHSAEGLAHLRMHLFPRTG